MASEQESGDVHAQVRQACEAPGVQAVIGPACQALRSGLHLRAEARDALRVVIFEQYTLAAQRSGLSQYQAIKVAGELEDDDERQERAN